MSASDGPTGVGSGSAPSLAQGHDRGGLPGPRAAIPGHEAPLPHRTPEPDGSEAEVTPLYAELLGLWAAREATIPGVLDADWRRLTSYRYFSEETEETLRNLRLQGQG